MPFYILRGDNEYMIIWRYSEVASTASPSQTGQGCECNESAAKQLSRQQGEAQSCAMREEFPYNNNNNNNKWIFRKIILNAKYNYSRHFNYVN